MMDAFTGRWELRNGVRYPVIEETRTETRTAGRPARGTFGEWDSASVREAHRLFNLGDRSLMVREGERLYQAGRKRAQRSGVMSPVDRLWATRASVKGSWEQFTRNNRTC